MNNKLNCLQGQCHVGIEKANDIGYLHLVSGKRINWALKKSTRSQDNINK